MITFYIQQRYVKFLVFRGIHNFTLWVHRSTSLKTIFLNLNILLHFLLFNYQNKWLLASVPRYRWYYYLRTKGETLGMNTKMKIKLLNLFCRIQRKMEVGKSEFWRKVCKAGSGIWKDQKEKLDCWRKT